jgi:nicotinamide-nucleotide amidase
MRPMLEGPVADYLQRRADCVLVSRTLNFFGIGESSLESRIREKIELMENPTVAPYAKPGEVQLRITAQGKTDDECRAMIAPVEEKLRGLFGKYCYGADYHNLQEAVVDVYRKRGLHLAAAESCTGGLVASRIVEVPGASEMFGCGIVSYCDETKANVLGVSRDTLREKTAVSAECAIEMARGARAVGKADVAVSTTGYAGPGGEQVGLVYVAAANGEQELVKELHLARGREDDREQIRLMASSWALRLALMLADHDTRLIDGGKK